MASSQNIPILQRTLRVLEAVTKRGRASAKQLAIDLEIPPATCYRILGTLEAANWLIRDEQGDYRLSFGISRLGGIASDMARFSSLSNRIMAALSNDTGCSVKISVREGDDWLMLARHENPKAIAISMEAGIRDNVTVGSVGKVLIRHMPLAEVQRILTENPTPRSRILDARQVIQSAQTCLRDGFSADLGETHPRIHAASVPLRLAGLEENAVITAFFPSQGNHRPNLAHLIEKLHKAAKMIEASLEEH